jgi:catechol 2,3-dioxygenase-like lactoylglutathione lyase family enzyme
MNTYGVTHIALRVVKLQDAEAFYCTLFDLAVAWREADTGDGWKTLPPDKSWSDAQAAQIRLGLVMLHRPGFALALEAVDEVAALGQLSHIGLQVDPSELDRLRQRAVAAGCQLVHDHATTVVFDDPFGVRWEPTFIDYTDPRQYSTGARTGQWLRV